MSEKAKEEILALEERLREAMVRSDVTALDSLLSDDLLFTGPDGSLVTKEIDLSTHRSGALRIHSLVPSERHVRLFGDTALVIVAMKVKATQGETPVELDMRYTRLWRKTDSWRVAAGHCSPILG